MCLPVIMNSDMFGLFVICSLSLCPHLTRLKIFNSCWDIFKGSAQLDNKRHKVIKLC